MCVFPVPGGPWTRTALRLSNRRAISSCSALAGLLKRYLLVLSIGGAPREETRMAGSCLLLSLVSMPVETREAHRRGFAEWEGAPVSPQSVVL